MTGTILPIRQAANSHLGRILSGRPGNVSLSPEGVGQAARLSGELGGRRLSEVHTSPVRRAQEKAGKIAQGRDVPLKTVGDSKGMVFGAPKGKGFAEFESDRPRRIRRQRRGDAGPAVQQSVTRHLQEVARGAPRRLVAMITPCDAVRAAVAAALGLSIHRILQFDVDPVTVTGIAIRNWGSRLITLNDRRA